MRAGMPSGYWRHAGFRVLLLEGKWWRLAATTIHLCQQEEIFADQGPCGRAGDKQGTLDPGAQPGHTQFTCQGLPSHETSCFSLYNMRVVSSFQIASSMCRKK